MEKIIWAPYGEHGRRGTAQGVEQIGQENWQKNHEKPSNSSSLGSAEVELHWQYFWAGKKVIGSSMDETLTLDYQSELENHFSAGGWRKV